MTPSKVAATVQLGKATTSQVVITNTGTAPATYQLASPSRASTAEPAGQHPSTPYAGQASRLAGSAAP